MSYPWGETDTIFRGLSSVGGRGAEAWEEPVCVHGVRCVWMCVHACMLFFFVMGTVEFGAFSTRNRHLSLRKDWL